MLTQDQDDRRRSAPAGTTEAPFTALPYTTPQGGGGTASAFTLRDLLILAFYHKRIILVTMSLSIIAGLIAATYAHKQYSADGLILMLIDREHTSLPAAAGALPSVLNIDGLKSVDSEIRILESREVIADTLKELGPTTLFPELGHRQFLGLLPPIPPEDRLERAIDLFRRQLRVEQQASSNIVRVSFTNENPEVAANTVNVLARAYLQRRGAIFDVPRSPFLSSELARYTDQLKGVETQIQKLKTDYQIIDLTQETLLAVNQVDSIVQRRRQTQERQAALQAEVASAKDRLAALPQTVFDFKQESNQLQNDNDHNVLLQLELDREKMSAQFWPNYPPLQDLERKIKTVKQAIKGTEKPITTTSREVRNPTIAFLSNHLLTLEIEQDSVNRQLGELDRQYKVASEKVDRLRTVELQLHDLERTRGVLEGIYRDYAQRTEAARAEEAANTSRTESIRVVQSAIAPITGTSMGPSLAIAGLIGGILLGAAAGVLATWMRQVYILPGEIERGLGIPALASFAAVEDEAQALNTPSTQQEFIHLAAQLIDQTVDDRGLSVAQFVTANEGDGEAMVARGLALELAKGRGLRTLVIDLCGDGTGQLRAINEAMGEGEGAFDGEKAMGADAADDTTTRVPADGEIPTVLSDVPLLWVSQRAPQSALGSLRTSIAQSRQMLERLRQRFDMVLILSPPVGTNHLARRLAPMVDANLLVARAEHTRAPVAARMRDSVLGSGGDIVGLVLTGRQFHIPQVIYRWL